jgi:hypothetical protein
MPWVSMAILILKVKVVVNNQRGDVGVVTDPIAPQVRGDEGEGQEEKDKKPTPFRVHRSHSYCSILPNQYQKGSQ